MPHRGFEKGGLRLLFEMREALRVVQSHFNERMLVS